MIDTNIQKHYIAIIGGSISGSEAAFTLAAKGFKVVVFEMNDLPYGKIEDGLPKWHVGLRDKQEKNIDQKLNHENILYVPNVKIGRDINFEDLVKNWGFTVIIIANGAWKDRDLPINDINKFIGNGLIYQNSLLHWYNHNHEPNYKGSNVEIRDGAVVVGGGLASLDVVKLGMIELVQETLFSKKGILVDIFEFEKKGIATVLESNNTNLQELQIKGLSLVYRRTARDMPLKSPKDDTPENVEKAKLVSEKLLQKYLDKYLFKFIPLSIPIDIIEKDGALKALVLQRVTIENGKIISKPGDTLTIETPMIISSIGSLPEQIKGLQYEGSWLKMEGKGNYKVYGYNNVFAIGNAVTGRGNIQESKVHGKRMTEKIIDKHLVEGDLLEDWLENLNTDLINKVDKNVAAIESFIKTQKVIPDSIIENILIKTKELQEKVGYTTYTDWIKSKTPIRLENLIK